ncbi:hypothetical protein [Maridesulfovibrio hydrothermalis]|uniref:PilZ domain-containing protein n=1 Tax=Maridesulfovibrio hydrothermalis AM13 = DSM 14728 TaxID=1121451 RepID=L0RCK1_9BACT|nr:hypothetical protein [Maridesulfovibrio hydrothermalis]CCO24513.1 conserved protein of unknown function [Maridesulfovibrio hydrothermalis AM13 = DSM 14728]
MDRDSIHYASVKTRIKGFGRFCKSIENQPIFRGFSGMQKHPAEDLDDSKVPEWLKAYVIELDRKLDQLMGMQSKKDLTIDFPIALEIIEISGNGMIFCTETEINGPGILEAVIEIEQIPLRLAGAKGSVKAGKKQNTWVMKFEKIREHDLESIIQFVFSQQRELIRNEKLG